MHTIGKFSSLAQQLQAHVDGLAIPLFDKYPDVI
jgi:hypothetical protein